jgi:oxalate decarboxylase/phosphoglucose isomerase-like protein (cupin superfamily)
MPLLSYRCCLEQQAPKAFNGGITRGASVNEFPISADFAGVSMRLGPGTIRELHWHANAAELAYVVSGARRTTISPSGWGCGKTRTALAKNGERTPASADLVGYGVGKTRL